MRWLAAAGGRLKAEIYSTTPVSSHPALVVVLHGDLYDPAPGYQYAFAQAVTQGFDAPAMPDRVRARLAPAPLQARPVRILQECCAVGVEPDTARDPGGCR